MSIMCQFPNFISDIGFVNFRNMKKYHREKRALKNRDPVSIVHLAFI